MNLKQFTTFVDKLEVRGLIMFSLLLQIILVSFASQRKRTSSKMVILTLWLAYLSADAVATYSLGLISKTQDRLNSYYHTDMLAFWTPFLLLHLGGPDTITAFSVEDSQLWLRHAITLVLQLIAAGYIFFRSLGGSTLLIPTLCILLAGTLKYAERTWALKKSSLDGLRELLSNQRDSLISDLENLDSLSPNLAEESAGAESSAREAVQLISDAYLMFQIFKKLFVDVILDVRNRDSSLAIFHKIKLDDAYKLIEIELNFVYDILYTKVPVIHSVPGRVIHIFSFISTTAAFGFFFFLGKREFIQLDKVISYILLGGALSLEIISLGLFVFSDWTIIMLTNSKDKGKPLQNRVLQALTKFRPPKDHRWSQSMGQCSFLKFSLVDRPTCFRKILQSLGLKKMWDGCWYVEFISDLDRIKGAIYEDLYNKSKQNQRDNFKPNIWDKFNNCRGEQAVQGFPGLEWSLKTDFDESLLVWHVATEICFNQDKKTTENPYRMVSNVLSRYMLYLLIVHPSTLSSTAGSVVFMRYQDSVEGAKKMFEENPLVTDEYEASNMLMNRNPSQLRWKDLLENRPKSVLWDAVQLAKQLNNLDEETKWRTASNVWIDMLCFAARHCRGQYHAPLLCVGGELLTMVWLLEIHLGMGIHYGKPVTVSAG